MKHQVQRFFCAVFMLTLCSCTQESTSTTPEDALFCDNIADQVQSVEQLHIASETTDLESSNATHIQYTPTYAMWFSVMDYADTLRDKTESEFRAIMRQRFENAASIGINTVYLHVRAYQDAYYDSALFPMGTYADPDIAFDPLEIMIEEAHRLSLSVHAWINPLRGPTTKAMEEMDSGYRVKQWYSDTKTNGTYLVLVNQYWWLNPAYPEVRQFIADGIAEIMTAYDVDGIHMDDYFYPTTDTSFDAAAFDKSDISDLSAFRLAQTNAMVSLIYDTIKSYDPDLIFSISPQGTLEGNYNSQYADVTTWGSEIGYCDVLIPQIYYGFENETAPFVDMVALWNETISCDAVSFVAGICTYKLGCEDTWAGSGKTEWQENLDIPLREVEFLLELDGVDGVAIYDYDATFCPETAAEAMAAATEAISKMLR